MRGENVPVIFGLKLRNLREERGLGLKELSSLAGMSTSYVNEIEKGKKYPKADKIIQLAEALGVPYDEMVSLKLSKKLNPLEPFLDSPIIQALPLQMFGLTPRDILDLVSRAPKEVSALVRTLVEIAGSYDMQVEHFFYAMLRSYQEAHDNYFEDIETAVARFSNVQGLEGDIPISLERLRKILTDDLGVVVEEMDLERYGGLHGFRSIWVQGPPPRLLINPHLNARQQAFQIGREIGYRDLGLKARGITSSRAEVESFEQVVNDFKASYYAGALLIPEALLLGDLQGLFSWEKWRPEAFLQIMKRFEVTPEMFMYRLTQLIPKHFGLHSLYFLRINHELNTGRYCLTKQLNMSGLLIPSEIGPNEHYCRRWQGISLLTGLAGHQGAHGIAAPLIGAQRSRYINNGSEFFHITLARPLTLTPHTNTSVTLGFRLEPHFKAAVKFWNDENISWMEVNESCERCGLSGEECRLRAGPPSFFEHKQVLAHRKEELEALLSEKAGS